VEFTIRGWKMLSRKRKRGRYFRLTLRSRSPTANRQGIGPQPRRFRVVDCKRKNFTVACRTGSVTEPALPRRACADQPAPDRPLLSRWLVPLGDGERSNGDASPRSDAASSASTAAGTSSKSPELTYKQCRRPLHSVDLIDNRIPVNKPLPKAAQLRCLLLQDDLTVGSAAWNDRRQKSIRLTSHAKKLDLILDALQTSSAGRRPLEA